MAQQWKPETAGLDVTEDTGDILVPLKRVRDQYTARAMEFEKANKSHLAAYYREQAENVGRLVYQ